MPDGESLLGSDGAPADEVALRCVGELVNEVQPGSMVTKFVLLVETADGDDRWYSSFTSPGIKAWESMGMLRYAMKSEDNFMMTADDDEGDD